MDSFETVRDSASFGMGTTSLGLQIIPAVFKALDFFIKSLDFGDNSLRLQLRAQQAQDRLASWVIASGWGDKGPVNPELRLRQNVIKNTLADILRLYKDIQKAGERYGLEVSDSSAAPKEVTMKPLGQSLSGVQEMVEKQLRSIDALSSQNPASNYRRYYFTARDGPRLEAILDQICGHLDFLENQLPLQLRMAQSGVLKENDLERIQDARSLNIGELCRFRDNALVVGNTSLAGSAAMMIGSIEAENFDREQRAGRAGLSEFVEFRHILEIGGLEICTHGVILTDKHIGNVVKGPHTGSRVLVEAREIRPPDQASEYAYMIEMQLATDSLCTRLASTGNSKPDDLLILPCVGHAKVERQINLLFAIPESTTVIDTLHDLLLSRTHRHFRPSLEERLALATKLARSTLRFHEAGWFHKAINASNVIFLRENIGEPQSIGSPYICGFEHSRPVERKDLSSHRPAEANIRQELYKHKDYRKKLGVDKQFRRTYDVFSLGMVLLEIGHWAGIGKAGFNKWTPEETQLDPDGLFEILQIPETSEWRYKSPVNDLSHRMGQKYQKAVRACFQGDFEREDGLRVFFADVVRPLEEALLSIQGSC